MKVDAAVAIIPARYNSTRFPGKPLAEIEGKPLIEYVYRRVQKARFFTGGAAGPRHRRNFGAAGLVCWGAILIPQDQPQGTLRVVGERSWIFYTPTLCHI